MPPAKTSRPNPSTVLIARRRHLRRTRRQHSPAGRWGMSGGLLLSLALVALIVSATGLYADLTRDLPSPAMLPALLNPPGGLLLEPTRLYDRTGQHVLLTLENPGAQRAARYRPFQPAAGPGLSLALAEATLAAEDPTFWSNPGFSLAGLTHGSHPTLAQRLVSNLMLADEAPGLRRSLRERLLAAQLVHQYGREQVLEWYLNSAAYGELVYGANPAAQVYFDKDASDLNLAEAALLAAVSQSPDLNPHTAPEVALERQRDVLILMLQQGRVTQVEVEEALATPLAFNPPAAAPQNLAPAFTRLVLDQLARRYGAERLQRGGLRVITSLDYDLQTQVSCAAAVEIARLEGSPASAAALDPACPAGRLVPTLAFATTFEPGALSAAALILDPQTGQVLALGGQAPDRTAVTAVPGAAPGSLLAPFIHLTAYARGLSPASMAWDIPASLPGGLAGSAAAETGSYQGPVSLRAALANDYLIPSVQLLAQVGADNVWRTAQQVGLRSLDLASIQNMLAAEPLLAGGQVTLLEAAQAYGVLANQGILAGQLSPQALPGAANAIEPVTILLATDYSGQPWLSCTAPSLNCGLQNRPVISTQLAYLLTHVLSDEIARWPSLGHPNPLEIGRPAGAKIAGVNGPGTHVSGSPEEVRAEAPASPAPASPAASPAASASHDAGAWTVGYTPSRVVAVWVGELTAEAASPSEISAASAGSAALWHALIQYASRDSQPQGWPVPAGISSLDVCTPSGMLPTAICPTITREVYLMGSEPTHPDNLYRQVPINRETGRLATVFTPPNLVEERVYLFVPPEAAAWAERAGLPTPPESYDILVDPPAPSPTARIDSPAMFAYVRGVVAVTGTAAGDDFAFYRLQIGQGLNPRAWLQIGSDSTRPVTGRTLYEWDTTGLSGLYALQLLVVRSDQRVETTLVQVTVDNQAPDLNILYPAPDQQIELAQTPRGGSAAIVLQAAAADIALKRVEFWMDGRLLGSLSQPPYQLAWNASPGSHTLRLIALDQAGNTTEAAVTFTVLGE